MIRHDDERVQSHPRKMIRNCGPRGSCRQPGRIYMHAASHELTKQADAILSDDRDEIRARLRIVIPVQADRMTLVMLRIEPAFHRWLDRDREYMETMHNCYSIRREWSNHLPIGITDTVPGLGFWAR